MSARRPRCHACAVPTDGPLLCDRCWLALPADLRQRLTAATADLSAVMRPYLPFLQSTSWLWDECLRAIRVKLRQERQ